MYKYTQFDADFVRQRNAQFRAQIERRLNGSLTEDEFKPLRLMNGLYLQLHAYMLRVAIPYPMLLIFSTHWAMSKCMQSRPRETLFETSPQIILPAPLPMSLKIRAPMPN